MDIKAALEEISLIEREKSKLELLQAQLKDKLDAYAKRLSLLGVKPHELDAEAKKLETDIKDKLEAIRSGPAKTQALKSRNPDASITSILEE